MGGRGRGARASIVFGAWFTCACGAIGTAAPRGALPTAVALVGASSYETRSVSDWVSDSFPRIEGDLSSDEASLGLVPVADSCVAAGASRLADFIAKHAKAGALSQPSADLLMRSAGVLEHRWGYASWSGPGLPPASLIRDTLRHATEVTADEKVVAFGVGEADGGDGVRVTVLAWAFRFIAFDAPVARASTEAAPLHLRGRTLLPIGDVMAAITSPRGDVAKIPAGHGDEVHLDFALPYAGVWQVELVGQLTFGPFPVVNFPVYVDVPDTFSPHSQSPFFVSEGDFSEELLRLVNASRAEAHLPTLLPDARLVEAAHAHSVAMRDEKFWGHNSPRTGTPDDRIRRTGLRAAGTGENIANGPAPFDVHEDLMQSPGHRATVLDPNMTHLGIGIVSNQESSPSSWIVTEDFARENPVVDVNDVRRNMLRSVNEERAKAKLPALVSNERMDAAADLAAHTLAAGGEAPLALPVAFNELLRLKLALPNTLGSGLRTSVIAPALTLSAFESKVADTVGIGVVQASRDDGPTNELFIVALSAQRMLPERDHETAVAEFLRAANAKRQALGLVPFVVDQALQKRADELAAKDAMDPLVVTTSAVMGNLGVRSRSSAWQYGAIDPSMDLSSWALISNPAMQHVGIGFAQGSSPNGPSNQSHFFLLAIEPVL